MGNLSSACFRQFLILFFILAPAQALPADLPVEPIPRVETTRHTGAILSMGADAEGRYLVTGSADRTARVWDLDDMKLLHVLRPPLAHDADNRLSAVAMSPDSEMVAVAMAW